MSRTVNRVLVTAAAVAAIAIAVDAVMVQAPYLAVLAIPFVVGVALDRRFQRAAAIVLALSGLLYTGIAINYVTGAGSEWPVGDYIGVGIGGAASAVAAAAGIAALATAGRRRTV